MTNNILSIKFAQVKILVITSYFLALVFDSMSNVLFTLGQYPSLTLLVMFYWTIKLQNHTHLLSALILGLLSDALFHTALGAHALIFSFLIFILLRIRLQLKNYPIWQQTFILTIYFYIFQTLALLLLQPTLSGTSLTIYWLTPLATLILWPAISRLLNSLTLRNL